MRGKIDCNRHRPKKSEVSEKTEGIVFMEYFDLLQGGSGSGGLEVWGGKRRRVTPQVEQVLEKRFLRAGAEANYFRKTSLIKTR